MMGSEHDGEVVNAAKMALRLIKDRGFTWDDVLGPAAPEVFQPPPPATPKPAPPPPRQPRQPRQQEQANPYTFLAGELLGAFTKRRRVAAADLALVNKVMNPFYFPNKEEQNRLHELFVEVFGKSPNAWPKAS